MAQHSTVGQYGHQGHDEPSLFSRLFVGLFRLIFPVTAYCVTLAAAWELQAVPALWFDGLVAGVQPSIWLTQGHILVPAAFLLNNLVNRRYGLDTALWHVVVSWAVLGVFVAASMARLDPRLPEIVLPPMLMVSAFVGALIVAHAIAAFFFDRTRGTDWWTAPLYASLIGGVVFVGIYYSIVQPGGEGVWLNRMIIDAGVKVAMAFVLLIPYFLLRPIVRPLPGFGGF